MMTGASSTLARWSFRNVSGRSYRASTRLTYHIVSAEEPLLKESIRRFVLFPIQYPEVRDASPCFRRNSPAPTPSAGTPTPTKRSSSARPPLSPVGSDDDANTRRKSVSFCDDHDVRIIYPDPPRPALKQARRAASRARAL